MASHHAHGTCQYFWILDGFELGEWIIGHAMLYRDWEHLTRIMQDMNTPLEDIFLEVFDDKDDSDDNENAEDTAPQKGCKNGAVSGLRHRSHGAIGEK
jgi:hypothetical protein